jgi:hypothetical protein
MQEDTRKFYSEMLRHRSDLDFFNWEEQCRNNREQIKRCEL